MRRRLLLVLLVVLAALALPASGQAFTTGIGDQSPGMFTNKYFVALHVRIARYIAPYDIAEDPVQENQFFQWLTNAMADGVEPHVAFYHSRRHPTHMPSVTEYTREVTKFLTQFPQVKSVETWNEANRGNVNSGPAKFDSPTAKQSADYYEALRAICHGCTIVGLDVLDSQQLGATLRYIRDFRRDVQHQPTIWGLHNYTDTNRFHSSGTRAVIKAVPGQVWLTETGGIVKFGRSFPNHRGSGLRRARAALQYMFRLARSSSRIKRLYIFQWSGSSSQARFDAGLMDRSGRPRPGYNEVKSYLSHH